MESTHYLHLYRSHILISMMHRLLQHVLSIAEGPLHFAPAGLQLFIDRASKSWKTNQNELLEPNIIT